MMLAPSATHCCACFSNWPRPASVSSFQSHTSPLLGYATSCGRPSRCSAVSTDAKVCRAEALDTCQLFEPCSSAEKGCMLAAFRCGAQKCSILAAGGEGHTAVSMQTTSPPKRPFSSKLTGRWQVHLQGWCYQCRWNAVHANGSDGSSLQQHWDAVLCTADSFETSDVQILEAETPISTTDLLQNEEELLRASCMNR